MNLRSLFLHRLPMRRTAAPSTSANFASLPLPLSLKRGRASSPSLDTHYMGTSLRHRSSNSVNGSTSTSTAAHPPNSPPSSPSASSSTDAVAAPRPAPLDPAYVDDLKKGNIHVWWFFEDKVPEATMKAAEDAWLNPQDYFSAGRARVESVARERIRTKLLIRGVLSRYLSADAGHYIEPRDIPFTWYARGKPKLAPGWGIAEEGGKREIWFNLTHTGGAMGLALGLDHEIGLDVERKDRVMRFDPLKLAKSQLHELEHAQLERFRDTLAAPAPAPAAPTGVTAPALLRPVTERLMWHWVLKESFCKATGMGINAAPSLKGHAALLWKDHLDSVVTGLAAALPDSHVHPDFHRVELRYDDRRMEVLKDRPLPPAAMYEFVLHEPTDAHVTSLCVRRLHGAPGLPRMRTFHLDGLQGGSGDQEVQAKALGCTVVEKM